MDEEEKGPLKRIVVDIQVDGSLDIRFSNRFKQDPINFAEMTRVFRGLKSKHREYLSLHKKRIYEQDRLERKKKQEKLKEAEEKEAVNV